MVKLQLQATFKDRRRKTHLSKTFPCLLFVAFCKSHDFLPSFKECANLMAVELAWPSSSGKRASQSCWVRPTVVLNLGFVCGKAVGEKVSSFVVPTGNVEQHGLSKRALEAGWTLEPTRRPLLEAGPQGPRRLRKRTKCLSKLVLRPIPHRNGI